MVIDASPPDDGRSLLATILLGFGPTILLVALFIWFFPRRSMSGAGGAGELRPLERAPRHLRTAEPRVTFADVAGIDEAENELWRSSTSCATRSATRSSARASPRRAATRGQPGAGKTLLARAVAGEAEAPFFSMAASEFVEAIVGVGASRVRDLFKTAKEAAPAIIFIDELDAVGRSASGGASGGQTSASNTQPDPHRDGRLRGRQARDRAGATNRPEVLDPAILRPGRFDRRVTRPSRPTESAPWRSCASTRAPCRWPRASTSSRSPPRRRA